MMMAHHSSPDDRSLADETIDEIRSSLIAYVEAPSRGDGLAAALNAAAREAREKSILPEKLLVVLKDIWYGLPSVQALNEPDDQVRLLQRVVTMCIKEYYAR